ncbi:hypothetical protein HKX48_005396 [Thoreauomyces humboldtii]|nr:hypothetical protein HKX48_005396 [Thoreauomyces humboldtii]
MLNKHHSHQEDSHETPMSAAAQQVMLHADRRDHHDNAQSDGIHSPHDSDDDVREDLDHQPSSQAGSLEFVGAHADHERPTISSAQQHQQPSQAFLIPAPVQPSYERSQKGGRDRTVTGTPAAVDADYGAPPPTSMGDVGQVDLRGPFPTFPSESFWTRRAAEIESVQNEQSGRLSSEKAAASLELLQMCDEYLSLHDALVFKQQRELASEVDGALEQIATAEREQGTAEREPRPAVPSPSVRCCPRCGYRSRSDVEQRSFFSSLAEALRGKLAAFFEVVQANYRQLLA